MARREGCHSHGTQCGAKTVEQCRAECMKHVECVGIEVCGESPHPPGQCTHSAMVVTRLPNTGPETGDVDGHHCDSNECILISSFIETHDAAGWEIYSHGQAQVIH